MFKQRSVFQKHHLVFKHYLEPPKDPAKNLCEWLPTEIAAQLQPPAEGQRRIHFDCSDYKPRTFITLTFPFLAQASRVLVIVNNDTELEQLERYLMSPDPFLVREGCLHRDQWPNARPRSAMIRGADRNSMFVRKDNELNGISGYSLHMVDITSYDLIVSWVALDLPRFEGTIVEIFNK